MAEFEQKISELEKAYQIADWERVQNLLAKLWQIDFHKNNGKCAPSWEQLFQTLLALIESDSESISDSAYHYLFIVFWEEYGPPWEDREQGEKKRRENFEKRIGQSLPVFYKNIHKRPRRLLRLVDEIVHAEHLCDAGPLQSVIGWLESLEKSKELQLPTGTFQITNIVYVLSRKPWEKVHQKLFSLLDDQNDLVRAYAARTLGKFYHEHESGELQPVLKDAIQSITSKEIERPGIAGPFLSDYYGIDLEFFEKESGVKIEDWFCEILSKRKGSEPETLPCSNGIDFYAHEIFGGRAGYIKKLLEMGHKSLAVEAATEMEERIDDLMPVLIELGNDEDPYACRQVCWHLAYHYQYLHPEGEKREFVKRIELNKGAEVYLNYFLSKDGEKYLYSATLYPRETKLFNEEQAWNFIDKIMPNDLRGEQIPHPGSVQRKPEAFILGNMAGYAYKNRALISLKGDVPKKEWRQIQFIWHGEKNAWNPEEYLLT